MKEMQFIALRNFVLRSSFLFFHPCFLSCVIYFSVFLLPLFISRTAHMPILRTETRAVRSPNCVTELHSVTSDPCTSGSTNVRYCKSHKMNRCILWTMLIFLRLWLNGEHHWTPWHSTCIRAGISDTWTSGSCVSVDQGTHRLGSKKLVTVVTACVTCFKINGLCILPT